MRALLLFAALAVCHSMPLRKSIEEVRAFCMMIPEDQRTTLYFPDPQDCHSWYVCFFSSADRTVLFSQQHTTCPQGLHWSQAHLTCVWNSGTTEQLCAADPCLDPVTKAHGYYVPSVQDSCRRYVQCDNDVSAMRCCPEGQVFDVVEKQCMLSEMCVESCDEGHQVPEEPKVPEPWEEDKVYSCVQGDHMFTLVTQMEYIRTDPDGTISEVQKCPDHTPYFSYRHCTCYSLEGLPDRDRKVPDGVTLGEVECYSDALIYHKTDQNQYTMRPADGSPSIQIVFTCPMDKLYFSIKKCACAPLTLADTLPENQCVRGDHIYEQVDDHSYKVGDIPTRAFSDVLTCPDLFPLWNLDKCYCDVDPAAPVPPVLSGSCNVYSMTDGKMGSTWVDIFGTPLDLIDGEACFDGSAANYLGIPFYSSNALGNKLTLGFRFKYDEYFPHPDLMPVVHNGIHGDQTVDVSISESEVLATIVTNTETCTVSVPNGKVVAAVFPAPPTVYDRVVLHYDGSQLSLRVEDTVVQVACSGDVKVSMNPMFVGTNFPGCIDDLSICKSVEDPFN